MSGEDWATTFDRLGAVWRHRGGTHPHAAHHLSTHHSAYYLNTDVLTARPEVTDDLVRRGLLPLLGDVRPDWVVAPAGPISAGLLLAGAAARALATRVGYVHPSGAGLMSPLRAGETALLVVDDVHSGASVLAAAARLEHVGVRTIGPIATLANFSGTKTLGGRPIVALIHSELIKWPADACPLCRAGSPALAARPEWHRLVGE